MTKQQQAALRTMQRAIENAQSAQRRLDAARNAFEQAQDALRSAGVLPDEYDAKFYDFIA